MACEVYGLALDVLASGTPTYFPVQLSAPIARVNNDGSAKLDAQRLQQIYTEHSKLRDVNLAHFPVGILEPANVGSRKLLKCEMLRKFHQQ